MNSSSLWRVARCLQTRKWLLVGIFVISSLLVPSPSGAQVNISLKAQATEWLMQDAPPNPPLRAWLDAVSMMIKQKNNIDAPVEITSSVLPSGLVQVQAKVGVNLFLWQVDYPKRKYYSMNKFTSDFMGLVAKSDPIRK
jgi:hypothetical protein